MREKLRRYNIVMGILHAVQGVLVLGLSNDFSVPITTNYLQANAAGTGIAPILETLTTLRVGPWVAAFFFLSAIAHIAVSLPGLYQWYQRNLDRGMNPARWIEYTFSSSLMIVVIAWLCGVFDLSSLIMIASLNATMILFGHLMELHNQTTQKTNWTAFVFG